MTVLKYHLWHWTWVISIGSLVSEVFGNLL